jgi:hypothetical protein
VGMLIIVRFPLPLDKIACTILLFISITRPHKVSLLFLFRMKT